MTAGMADLASSVGKCWESRDPSARTGRGLQDDRALNDRAVSDTVCWGCAAGAMSVRSAFSHSSHVCPQRLKAADFNQELFATAETVPFPVNIKIQVNIKVKGDGQECPSHTSKFRGNFNGSSLRHSGPKSGE